MAHAQEQVTSNPVTAELAGLAGDKLASDKTPAPKTLTECVALLNLLRDALALPWLCDEHAATILEHAIEYLLDKHRSVAITGFERNDSHVTSKAFTTACSVAIVGELIGNSHEDALKQVAEVRVSKMDKRNMHLYGQPGDNVVVVRRRRSLLWHTRGRDVPDSDRSARRYRFEHYLAFGEALGDALRETPLVKELRDHESVAICSLHGPLHSPQTGFPSDTSTEILSDNEPDAETNVGKGAAHVNDTALLLSDSPPDNQGSLNKEHPFKGILTAIAAVLIVAAGVAVVGFTYYWEAQVARAATTTLRFVGGDMPTTSTNPGHTANVRWLLSNGPASTGVGMGSPDAQRIARNEISVDFVPLDNLKEYTYLLGTVSIALDNKQSCVDAVVSFGFRVNGSSSDIASGEIGTKNPTASIEYSNHGSREKVHFFARMASDSNCTSLAVVWTGFLKGARGEPPRVFWNS